MQLAISESICLDTLVDLLAWGAEVILELFIIVRRTKSSNEIILNFCPCSTLGIDLGLFDHVPILSLSS